MLIGHKMGKQTKAYVDICLIDLQYVELRVCNRNQE